MLRRSDRLDLALATAARGLALFPIPAGGRIPGPGWQQACTTDPRRVELLVDAGNLGIGCRASDVVGLDLDNHRDGHNGLIRFAEICAEQGVPWPGTFTTRTPSGGLHLYFRAGRRPIPSVSGDRSGLGLGIDIRGPGRTSGGYLLAPGSRLGDRLYGIEHDVPVAELPAWLAITLPRSAVPGGGELLPLRRADR